MIDTIYRMKHKGYAKRDRLHQGKSKETFYCCLFPLLLSVSSAAAAVTAVAAAILVAAAAAAAAAAIVVVAAAVVFRPDALCPCCLTLCSCCFSSWASVRGVMVNC